MEKKCLVIPWISLYCLLMGMFRNFCWVFGCQVIYGRHVLPFLLISAVSLFCIVQLKRKYAVLVSAAGLLGMTMYILWKFEELTSDFLKVVYYINLRSEEYDGSLLFGFEGIRVAGTAMDSNVFLRIVLIFCAIFISLFVFRMYSRGCGFLPVYAVMSLGLLVGRTPDGKAITYLVIGVVLALMWVARHERGGRHFFEQKSVKKEFGVVVYFVFAGILFVGLTAAKQVSKKQEADILKNADKYLTKQHQMEQVIKNAAEEVSNYIKGQISVEGDGKLDNEEPHYADDTVIKVTMAQKPTASIYLKGFIGGEYQNGEWLPCNTEEFMNVALTEEFVKDFWNTSYQFFNYYISDREDFDNLWSVYGNAATRSKMLVEYVGKGKFSSYAYVPYHANVHSIANENSKESVIMDGENGMKRKSDSYFVEFFPMGLKCYQTVREQIEAGSFLMSYSNEKKTRIEYNTLAELNGRSDAYSSYVRETYSKLPNELSALREFIGSIYVGESFGQETVSSINALEAGENVAAIVKKQASYSLELEPIPEGMDYVEYFLFEQGKGYCEHFATAGTLLLRAKGVPARFVQGYRIDPDMFEANGDGTYTAEVLDSNAHAWTEVFEGEYAGWYPIEMTPGVDEGLGAEGVPTATPALFTEKPSEKPEEYETDSKVVETEKPTATPKVTKKTETEQGSAQKGDTLAEGSRLKFDFDEKYVFFALGILVLLAFLSGVIYLRLRMRRYCREFVAGANDRNLQICIRNAQLLHFLKYCGQRDMEHQNEDEWCMRASWLCGDRYDEEVWQELKRVMQKAAFSENSITEDEFIFYCDMVEDVERYIWKKCGRMRKCYLRMLGLKK